MADKRLGTLNERLRAVQTTDDFVDLLEELREINLVKSTYVFSTVAVGRRHGVHDDGKLHAAHVFIEMRSRVRNTDSKVWFSILNLCTQKTKGYAPRNLHKYIKITPVGVD